MIHATPFWHTRLEWPSTLVTVSEVRPRDDKLLAVYEFIVRMTVKF